MASPAFRRLEGARAIVTGASSGIGRAVALAFAREGASVLLNYRSGKDEAERLAGEIRALGGKAVPVQADVSEPRGCATLYDALAQHFGGLDILVANAGVQQDAAFADMSLEQWRTVLDVNLTGVFLCAQAAVRTFRAQGPRAGSPALGKILFMSSVHEVIPWAGHANYAASKGGVKLLMQSMAQELSGEKIRVNAIAPGAIKTDINREAWEDPAAEKKLLELIPYGRVGEPEDVARAAVWLASDESDYVVGTTLFVDGGMLLYPGFREGG